MFFLLYLHEITLVNRVSMQRAQLEPLAKEDAVPRQFNVWASEVLPSC